MYMSILRERCYIQTGKREQKFPAILENTFTSGWNLGLCDKQISEKAEDRARPFSRAGGSVPFMTSQGVRLSETKAKDEILYFFHIFQENIRKLSKAFTNHE